MKKHLPCALGLLLLFTAGCASEDIQSVACPAVTSSSPTASDIELTAPTSSIECESVLDFSQTYDDAEMRIFLQKAINREPASIILNTYPTKIELIYDCVTFTIAEYYEDYTDKWYYTDLEATSTSAETIQYQLTGIGTFTEGPLHKPPETFFLTELPADTAPLPSAKPSVEPSEPPEKYTLEMAIANGDYVNCHGEIYNSNAMDTFLAKVAVPEEAAIRTVQFTVEGDPILTDISYDGTLFTVTEDTTQDAFGNGMVGTNYYTTLELVYIPETDITEYRMTEPALDKGHAFPQDYMVLKYDLGNTTEHSTAAP